MTFRKKTATTKKFAQEQFRQYFFVFTWKQISMKLVSSAIYMREKIIDYLKMSFEKQMFGRWMQYG